MEILRIDHSPLCTHYRKTVQTIAFLAWLKHTNQKGEPEAGNSLDKAVMLDDDEDDDDDSVAVVNSSDNGDGPHLVIAPASVLSNWAREFENFAPHLNVLKYHGSQAERREQQAELRPHLAGREASRRNSGIEPIDVILAPITYFQKEKSDDRSFLRKFHFDYLVVDEAHVLKNASGTRYKSLDRFSTKHRLLLTGTPVQNSPKELMSLLCFLMPLFSRKSATFDDNDQNDGGASMLQHFVKNEGGKNGYSDKTVFKKLKQLFAPFVLRRSKDDVLSQILPPKERKVEFVELDSAGRNTYDSILAKHIKEKKNGTTSREHLFTQLRKAANHPLMLRTRYKLPAEKEHLAHTFYRYGAFSGEGCTKLKVAEELELFNDFQIHLTALELISENGARRADCGRYVLEEEDLFSSAKFVRLRKLLPELIAGGHRILIFSVWTSCLDLLSCLLEQMTFDYLRMDGSTPVTDRQNLIDKFNGDTTIPIFLLSTKACGLGINLTAADTCIMHDLDFNPFNDLQAEDRCHRIGQKKPVTVFKLVSKDTVDEDIYGMQQRKAMMNAAIMDNGSTAKEGTKEKDAVMRAAVDRFLKSPKAKSPQTLADEKENETKNESAII
jgi:SWI/SNF-related matrix-associated actin-dependent regulator 1 of chromatin subfamily A